MWTLRLENRNSAGAYPRLQPTTPAGREEAGGTLAVAREAGDRASAEAVAAMGVLPFGASGGRGVLTP